MPRSAAKASECDSTSARAFDGLLTSVAAARATNCRLRLRLTWAIALVAVRNTITITGKMTANSVAATPDRDWCDRTLFFVLEIIGASFDGSVKGSIGG